MNIELLGTLDVRENGVSITPTAPKPRQVLALLALHADQVVSVAALTEELWGSVPPRSARTTLQTYVLQLRELITAALEQGRPEEGKRRTAKNVLATLPGAISSTAATAPATSGSSSGSRAWATGRSTRVTSRVRYGS